MEEAASAAYVLCLYLEHASEPDGAHAAGLLHRDLERQVALLRAFMNQPDDPGEDGARPG